MNDRKRTKAITGKTIEKVTTVQSRKSGWEDELGFIRWEKKDNNSAGSKQNNIKGPRIFPRKYFKRERFGTRKKMFIVLKGSKHAP